VGRWRASIRGARAACFERTASPAMVKSIYRFKTDKVLWQHEYEAALDWWGKRQGDWRTPKRFGHAGAAESAPAFWEAAALAALE